MARILKSVAPLREQGGSENMIENCPMPDYVSIFGHHVGGGGGRDGTSVMDLCEIQKNQYSIFGCDRDCQL